VRPDRVSRQVDDALWVTSSTIVLQPVMLAGTVEICWLHDALHRRNSVAFRSWCHCRDIVGRGGRSLAQVVGGIE